MFKYLILLAAFLGFVLGVPLVGEAGGRVVVQRQAVVVRAPRANVVVQPQRVFSQRQAVVVQPHFQSFRQQPVIVQQQLGVGGYGGVQAIVQPQCVGGSCGQLLLVR
jgi:hypothetical protein